MSEPESVTTNESPVEAAMRLEGERRLMIAGVKVSSPQTTPERAMLEKFLAWNKRWPKSSQLMSHDDVVRSDMELDDIMTEAEEMMK